MEPRPTSTVRANPFTPTQSDHFPVRKGSFALRFNLLLAVCVWVAWLVFGGHIALHHLVSDWRVAMTMVFGSFVGGGTSEGGGAIAFPIFTKLLHIAPRDARNFSLAIQSVGMGAASISIFYLRIPIEKRSLLYAGLPGIIGVAVGACFIAPLISPIFVRTSFTVLVSSMGVALLILNREKTTLRNQLIPIFGPREKLYLAAAGLLGGIVSSLVGTGENSLVFMVLVLLFRVNEKVVTPTTVVLMTMVTIPGFLLHVFLLKDVTPAVLGYWLAAIPVAAFMAPLGALACSRMKRHSIVLLLLFLIALEFISTALLVPLPLRVLWVSLGTLVVFGSIDVAMSRALRYRPENFQP
jgi:uncharacterized membrane protein YfcA